MENSEFCKRQFAWEDLGVAVSDMKTFMICLTLGIMIDPFSLCDSYFLRDDACHERKGCRRETRMAEMKRLIHGH